jgi:uncharacterized protein with FMN-binding domain
VRRAPAVLAATAAALAATLSFHAHAPRTSAAGATAVGGRRFAGAAASTPYGDVQVKVTVSAARIVAVQAVELPSRDPKSVAIGAYAEPLLRASTLGRQSASIDVVSGATYTSDGYKASLQSALDKAGL